MTIGFDSESKQAANVGRIRCLFQFAVDPDIGTCITAEPVWHSLANTLAGAEFHPTSPARVRASEACRQRRLLVIIEGGEEVG